MADLIRGKVARVLNSREVAFNVGKNNRVEVGMYFDILDPKGESIEDPDTGESLGSINRPKVRVKVTKVQENLSVASTYRTKRINVGGVGPLLSDFSNVFMPPKWETRYETLKTKEKTWEDLDEVESYVKAGDPVVQAVPATHEKDEVELGAN